MTPFPRDLVALVPDNDYQEALRGLLTKRTLSLRIRPITFTIHKHARHDPGCFNTAPELLAGFLREAHHALVVFDHEGSGAEAMACADAAHHLRERLARRGWGDRAAVVSWSSQRSRSGYGAPLRTSSASWGGLTARSHSGNG